MMQRECIQTQVNDNKSVSSNRERTSTSNKKPDEALRDSCGEQTLPGQFLDLKQRVVTIHMEPDSLEILLYIYAHTHVCASSHAHCLVT